MPLKSRYNASFSGNVTYGNNVVLSIIALAAQEINGVSSLSGKGIRADINGKNINVDVFINVKNGVSCADLAYRVQDNIKKSVETMTFYKVNTINVNILGVDLKDSDNGGAL